MSTIKDLRMNVTNVPFKIEIKIKDEEKKKVTRISKRVDKSRGEGRISTTKKRV